MPERKIYLGDSVYAEFDGYGLVLTTENGNGPSNTIHLEPGHVERMWTFLREHRGTPAPAAATPPSTEPMAYAVYCKPGSEYDYKVFTERSEAEQFADGLFVGDFPANVIPLLPAPGQS